MQENQSRMSSHQNVTASRSFLKELEFVCKKSWLLILGGGAIGFVIAALSLQGAVYSYPVEMQVTTVQSTTGSGGGSGRGGLSQLSGLASLANIALPTTQNEMQFQLFVDSLTSRDLANELAKNQDVLITLYGDQWDPITKTWHEPPVGLSTRIKNSIRGILGLAPQLPWHAPNGENIQSFLANSLLIGQDPRKAYMLTLSLTTGSRDFSMRFLTLLVQTADERLRQKALERARIYIDYLTAKLATVTVAEHRDALTQALGDQERYAMVASSGKPFAAEVFQSPWASNLPASPTPKRVFMFWVLVGIFSSVAFAYLRFKVSQRDAVWVQNLPAFIRRPLQRLP